MRRLPLLALAGVVLATGCNTPPARRAEAAAVTSPTAVAAAESSPSNPRWHLHPPALGLVNDGEALGDGSWLLVDDRGRRWHARPFGPTGAESEATRLLATAAAEQAPAGLAAVTREPTGPGFLLLDVAGDLYRTRSLLDTLTRAPRPAGQLVAIETARDGVIGIELLGAVARLEQAGGWSPVAPNERLFDVAVGSDGSVLGLAMPEALVESGDGGRTWRRVAAAASIGARRLSPAKSGVVVVHGLHRNALWRGFGSGLADATGNEVHAWPGDTEGTTVAAAPGPSAAALAEGSAVLSGSSYYAAIEATNAPELAVVTAVSSRWIWARGALGQPLELGALPVAERCDSVHLAAAGKSVLLGCVFFDAEDDRAMLELHASPDGGRQWRRRAAFTTPETAAVTLALAADHTVLVAGACLTGAADCEPRAPLRMALHGSGKAEPVRAADLQGRASAPVFSVDGTRAYFVGRRAKDERQALFVSRDGARSFAAIPIEPPRLAARGATEAGEVAAALWDLLAEDAPASPSPSPGADGSIGLAFDADVPLYAVCDEEGRVRQLARLPQGTVAVSGAGGSILALVATEASDGATALAEPWQSSDGGRSFRKLVDAPAFGLEELEATGEELGRSVRCSVAGCVVGELASRFGWEDGERREASAPLHRTRSSMEPAVLTPVECTLDQSTGWRTIRSVHSDSGNVLPTPAALMRGGYAWTVLQYWDETGEATVVSSPADGAGAALAERRLLAPVRDRAAHAIDVAHQMEGYVVARAPLPTKGAVDGSVVRELTVTWLDAFADARGTATVPSPGHFGARSVTPGPRPGLYGTLLSVAGDRVFVSLDRNDRELRLVGASPTLPLVLQYPTWPSIVPGLRLEEDALVVSGQPMALGWLLEERRQTAALGLAPLGPAAADPRFLAVAPTAHPDREVAAALSYRGNTTGITLHMAERERPSAWASFSPIGPDGSVGSPIALPTQASLGDGAPACSPTERSALPRLLAPRVAGRRRPVLVRADGGSLLLLTDAAVLYGTLESPCVAAWSAVGLGPSSGGLLGVLSGNLQRSWLFRATPGVRAALDVIPMACQRAPDAPLPAELWAADGTAVRRGP